ncbi:DNA mismatch repair protein MutS [Macrococcus epidermidis]|uniref:DNA mismatch repair protein MutS n=1 Tax=Macrococcus epidermidis TaxID=1902580 RepID=A0A327ZVY9_9STAP|nr:DNA mismatch repair protein MutS [Macrococcus epidermidis]RAK46580.1 DNA mismatch repair protein MutS [Macrococcus epidermidis]
MSKPTPMMAQYLQMKELYKDTILFFRLGDFYEMFYDDAILAAKELEITLTRRDKKNAIPMCGVPHHSAKNYIERLIEKGYKVAIAEQMEDPKLTKGMVKREVVQIITPGTVMDDMISENESNYLACLYKIEHDYIIAYSDVSTGELKVTQCDETTMMNELSSISPKEIIVNFELPQIMDQQIRLMTNVVSFYESHDTFNLVDELDAELQPAVNLLLSYIKDTQMKALNHIDKPIAYEALGHMRLDMYAKRNLELTESIRLKTKKGTLLSIYNQCRTPMGNRRLKDWIERPLVNKEQIEARLSVVRLFNDEFILRHNLREALTHVYDIERLAGRVQFGNVNAKDLIQLKYSLEQLPRINELLQPFQHIVSGLDGIQSLAPLYQMLEDSIVDEPPVTIKEGGIFKDGYNVTLDEYRDAQKNGKAWLAELQAKERERTGVKSLKISYNKVFGYYIEISKANLVNIDIANFGYDRKQTLSNAERFITEELKEKEALILGAEEKAIDLEYEAFIELREQVKTYIPNLKRQAKRIAELDCLQNFSEVATNNNYTEPVISSRRVLDIKDARHPVVEQVMERDQYVPNDCLLDDNGFIYLITGPNMSGKSTYMRQVALISIMAQMGSFVPASRAELPIFDQIFTRIGAADDLVSGQSTFMVEMLEAKNALVNATENSLIIFDEIGRGTSTYDGLSLAQSMIEYVHNHIGAKTLFSTHYHELVGLDDSLDGLNNIHVAAKEYNGELIFLHKIMPGAVENSYGIHVAKLANLPEEIINRAGHLLETFENYSIKDLNFVKRNDEKEERYEIIAQNIDDGNKNEIIKEQEHVLQPSFDLFGESENNEIITELKNLTIESMTPIEALLKLQQLKSQIK